jgi:hypothetical protein
MLVKMRQSWLPGGKVTLLFLLAWKNLHVAVPTNPPLTAVKPTLPDASYQPHRKLWTPCSRVWNTGVVTSRVDESASALRVSMHHVMLFLAARLPEWLLYNEYESWIHNKWVRHGVLVEIQRCSFIWRKRVKPRHLILYMFINTSYTILLFRLWWYVYELWVS